MAKTVKTPRAIRYTALYLIFSLLFQLLSPLQTLALTGGPGQPEYQGFTTVNVDESVDPATGEFKYKIALLSIPGPGGDEYPLNLTYKSGATMEDEASWVGEGWSLNPGAITRSVRGVPDDFRGPVAGNPEGDFIMKRQYIKPNINVAMGMNVSAGLGLEALGAPIDFETTANANVQLYNNSQVGPGIMYGFGLSAAMSNQSAGGLSANLGLNFDSNDGPSLQPSLSFAGEGAAEGNRLSLGLGYSSRQGITSQQFIQNYGHNRFTVGTGLTYAAATEVPGADLPQGGFNVGLQVDLEAGAMGTHVNIPIGFTGNLSVTKVKDYMQQGYAYPAFGSMYSEQRTENDAIENDRALMDYNREKNHPIHAKVPMLPISVMTHDIYAVSGAGINGTFKVHRNDAGIFYGPKTTSDNVGVHGGVEVAASTGVKVGFDPSISFVRSYSGKWRDGDQLALSMLGFRKTDDLTSANGIRPNNPFVYKFTGEFLTKNSGEMTFTDKGGHGPALINIHQSPGSFEDFSKMADEVDDEDAKSQMRKKNFFSNLPLFKASAFSSLNGIAYNGTEFTGVVPPKRETLIQYFSKAEKQTFGYPAVKNIYTGTYAAPKTGLLNPNYYQSVNLNQPHIKGHHVVGYDILKPDGSRYIYDVPLYNKEHHEFFFAIKGKKFYQDGQSIHPSKTIQYPELGDRLDQHKGATGTRDRSYTQNSTGPYAHTYLLSYIVDANYIDVDGNGPSNEDMGFWAKFSYYGPESYKWRMPYGYGDVNYSDGFHSSAKDDKATLMYGVKEIGYLQSIQTKTHIAIFYLGDRTDGIGAGSINGGINGGSTVKKLEKIELYAKSDLTTPIKSVHFVYETVASKQLCTGIPNSSVNGGGKLTLKELYFTYGNSSKGSQIRYKFDYGNIYTDAADGSGYLVENGTVNLPYSTMKSDRWGNYAFTDDPDRPYTNQMRDSSSQNERKKIAVSWNLTKIELPTGGVIRIDYESGDYGFVQDKPATAMVKITGMGKRSPNDPNIIQTSTLDNGEVPIRNGYDLVFFEPLEPIATSLSDAERKAIIRKYVSRLPAGLLYFKTWQRLKIPKNDFSWAYDYVTGYARPKKGPDGLPLFGYTLQIIGNDSTIRPYIQMDVPDNPAKNYFRAAGLQYLRYQRTDLNMPQDEMGEAISAAQALTGMMSLIPQIMELISGYYKAALLKDHCAMMGNAKPSYLKLNVPDGRKFGGTQRVRKLTISDSWSMDGQLPVQYGTEFLYQNEDSTSSGVATYEPLIGNDENPLKIPHYYGPDNRFVNNDPAFYLEEPFGESYFPAPSIVYGRTVIVNIANNSVTRSGDGIKVNEYYTAKDYPITTSFTPPERTEDRFDFMLPMIGSISMNARGYSQGYYIELNDMHGKAKSDMVYDADLWDRSRKELKPGSVPTQKTFYRYKSISSYTPNVANRLANTVTVTDRTGVKSGKTIGESSELFAEMAEDHTYTISAGAQLNMAVDPVPYGIWVTPFPSVSYYEQSARMVTTTKVVSKMGVLEEIESYKDGVNKVTRNLVFDDETGQPILTAVTDDYDDPTSRENNRYVYNMEYPAYWWYTGMAPAYQNYRLTFSGSFASIPEAAKYFEAGDEVIRSNGSKLWISKVTENACELKTADNSPINNTFSDVFTIVRSGKRNLQTLSAGKIVALSDPTQLYASQYLLQIFTTRMDQLARTGGANTTHAGVGLNWDLGSITLCGMEYKMLVQVSSGKILLTLQPPAPAESCTAEFINTTHSPTDLLSNSAVVLGDLRFEYINEERFRIHANGYSSSIYNRQVSFSCTLCQQADILHAQATEFSAQWIYRPEFLENTGNFFATKNDYITGRAGVWRPKQTNGFYMDRKQYGIEQNNALGVTEIGRDGVFKHFVPFQWTSGNGNNNQAVNGWRWLNTIPVNGYSPHGMEIENINPLGIYSAALWGFNQTLTTATAQNAAYGEIGFDAFEERGNGVSTPYMPCGHINLKHTSHNPNASAPLIINTTAHTGKYALSYTGINGDSLYIDIPIRNTVAQFTGQEKLQFAKSKSYTIGFWYKVAAGNVSDYWYILARNNTTGTNIGSAILNLQDSDIEGWRRCEFTLTVPQSSATSNTIRLALLPSGNNQNIVLDDVRIHPANAQFTSSVYENKTLQLLANLDQNNYATFYLYDAERNLVQTKVETEKGILTTNQSRKNVQH